MARIFVHAVACAAVIACSSAAFARDLAVPSRYPTIARAMRAAKPGDRVVVSGGKWKHVRVTKANVALVGRDGAVIVGTATLSGHDADLDGFTIHGSILATKRAKSAYVSGNTLVGKGDIRVAGEFTVVIGNTVSEGTIHADGHDVSISGNVVTSGAGPDAAAIEVLGAHVWVERNDVSHSMAATGIVVRADGATVTDNAVHAESGGDAIVVEAGVTLVAGNTIADAADSVSNGISLNGDANTARDNTISGMGADGVQVVSGDYNSVTSNVVTGARCGINVCAEATDTLIDNCTATGACMGLMNAGIETSVTGCTFTGNRDHDVAVSVPCQVFQGNQFSTSVGTLVEPPPGATPEEPVVGGGVVWGGWGDGYVD